MNTESQRTLIAFATYWGSKFGGINSFNADLVAALGLAFYRSMRVICVVLDADEADVAKALQNHQVTVLSLGRKNDSAFSPDFLGEVETLLSQCGCTLGADTVCLGHDRITGDIALAAAQKIGGRSALIHHMSYAHYEAYAESAQQASAKKEQQRWLFAQADVLLAVGPLLRDALHDMVGKEATMLIPGLQEIETCAAPRTFTAFLSGRVSKDTHKIKQAYLGVAGFAQSLARANADPFLAECLTAARAPSLTVRGLSLGQSTLAEASPPETDLKRLAEEHAQRAINLWALPFTIDRGQAFDELRRASVALMPSWHEGFGLVGWEAIAAGVPLILSQQSGVYRLLGEMDSGIYQSLVFPIDVRGLVDEPYFRPEDSKEVADAILQIARDPQAARRKASTLRERLLQKECDWKNCARTLVCALGWEPVAIPGNLPAPLPVEVPVSESVAQPAAGDLLDLPVPQWQPGKGLANSQLLRAEEAVIPFDAAAQPFLDEQLAWAKDAAFPLAARLLIGPGGSGKTRLALQLCAQLRSEGWWAGFLRRPAQFTQIHARLKAGAEPALIVIDYAETRIEDLFELIKPLILSPVPQLVRIMLLARSGGDWWDRLDGRDSQCESFFAGQASSGPYSIPDLHITSASREAAFQRAMQRFSVKVNLPVPSHSPDLSADHYAHPLLVQMAALLALHNEQPSTAEGLTRSLVNHEKRYWGLLFKDTATSEEQAAQLMALSTLCDGIQTIREIEFIWKDAECGSVAQLKSAFNRLKILYPHKGGLQSLRPDLLGEALVTQVLLSDLGQDILNALLDKAGERIRRHTWAVLSRILRQRADLIPLVQDALALFYSKNAKIAVEVCCQTPSPLPAVMESAYKGLSDSLKLQVSQQLLPLLSDDQLSINDLSAYVLETRLSHFRHKLSKANIKKAEQEKIGLIKALFQTGDAQHRCGNLDRAMELAAEAVACCENLVQSVSGRYERALADALNNYAIYLGENGRYEDALGVAKKSVEVYENLAKNEPQMFEINLASSLNTYSIQLNENGDGESALLIAKKVVDIEGRKAKGGSAQYKNNWASSLNNYASRLSENGFIKESLGVAKQSVEIRECLAKDSPGSFEHYLSGALINYANRLGENGKYEDALTTAVKALKVCEHLIKIKPERFEGDWAVALNNCASGLSDCGRSEEALEMARKATEVYVRLGQKKPDRYEIDWAVALNNYANRLTDGAKYKEALGATYQMNEILQRWSTRMPLKHGSRQRYGILKKFFITWLCGENISVEMIPSPLSATNTEYSKREWYGVFFSECCIRACFSTEFRVQLGHLENGLEQWVKLDVAQQQQHEEMFFLVAAMIEKASATNKDVTLPPADWRTRYEAMAKRRRGNIPMWLLDAAKKLGLELPAYSLTRLPVETATRSSFDNPESHNPPMLPEHM